MDKLKEAIEKEKQKIARLRKVFMELRQAQENLQVLERAYELVGGTIAPPHEARLNFTAPHHSKERGNLTNAEIIIEILQRHNKELHLNEIRKEMKDKYGRETSKTALRVAVTREIKKNGTFSKVSPATYGLSSWYSGTSEESKVPDNVEEKSGNGS